MPLENQEKLGQPYSYFFSFKKVLREHYLLIWGSLDKGVLTLINIYASSVEPEKYVRLLLSNLEKHMDISVIVVGDFNTPLSALDISIRQNTSKDMRA